MSYHKFLSTDSVKTITLQGVDCLRANTIIDNLIKDGCTIIPSALFPNEIQIRYVSSRINNAAVNDIVIVPNNAAVNDMDIVSNNIADSLNAEPNNYNVIQIERGNAGWAYTN
jgi:hypothetical protein